MSQMGRGFVPSPGLVVAVLALVLGVVGTATAGPGVLERAITKAKVKAIADRQIDKRAGGLTVKSANPLAFAHVLADGSVDAANSKAIQPADVKPGSTPGYFCFSGLEFQPRGGSATVDWETTGPVDALVAFGLGDGTECPVGTQFFVDTRQPDGTGSVATAFFVSVYR